jgi:hypothetical protein
MASSRDTTLNTLVEDLCTKSEQATKYAQIKKAVERIPLTFTPQQLATLLDEDGPMFLKTSQACQLKQMLSTKVSEFNYVFHHVICSRVLDFWKLVHFI